MIRDTPTRVLIVDDHTVVRSGLRYFFTTIDDIEVVGEARTGVEALTLCDQLKPDVVLMDIMMPDMDGVETTLQIRRQHPTINVLTLTNFEDGDLVRRALQAGAIGYLLKDVETRELIWAVRQAAIGRGTMASAATQALIEAMAHPEQPGADLSPREREILSLMTSGLSNEHIATNLCVSRNTVRHHVRNILSKLDAANRTEAVALAVQHHMV